MTKDEIIAELITALEFYADGRFIRAYIPEYLEHAMMVGDSSSRYIETICERGAIARMALNKVRQLEANE